MNDKHINKCTKELLILSVNKLIEKEKLNENRLNEVATKIPSCAFGFAFKPAGKQKVNISELSPFLKDNVKEYINSQSHTFQSELFEHIDKSSKTDSEIYNNAGIDRRVFSRIRCDSKYIPSKEKIICLAIALKLNIDGTISLLNAGGYTLSDSIKRDRIIKHCIELGVYDIQVINELLITFGEQEIWKYD